MHPAEPGGRPCPVLAWSSGLGGRLTLLRQPAQPLYAGCPPPPRLHREWLHHRAHRVGSRQHWSRLRLPPAGHAVQDGIATGIEGLDYLRIGLRPQFYRDGIKLVG